MKLLRKRDILEEGYSNAFLGYGPEETNFAVELTYSKAPHSLQLPLCFFQQSSIIFYNVAVIVLPCCFQTMELTSMTLELVLVILEFQLRM